MYAPSSSTKPTSTFNKSVRSLIFNQAFLGHLPLKEIEAAICGKFLFQSRERAEH